MYDHLCNTSADINLNRAADADDEGDIVIYIGADIYTGLMTSDCAPLQMQILPPPNKRFVRARHYNTGGPRGDEG